jgi:6-phosphogluconolactonase
MALSSADPYDVAVRHHFPGEQQTMISDQLTRRDFCKAASAGALGLPLAASARSEMMNQPDPELLLYVGTYTTGKSEGIYLYRMNLISGELKPVGVTGDIVNPSFLTIDPRRKFLYSVAETAEFSGQKSGALAAFAINQQTGELKLLNRQPSMGAGPCYVTTDQTGSFALTANYGGGSVAVLPIKADGSLGEPTATIQHTGSSVNPQRQKEPHAHCIVVDPGNRFVFSADLGVDKILIYRFDAKAGKLVPHTQPFASVRPGAGPRHFAFHPRGRHAFVINELDSTMIVFAYDKAQGRLQELQTISTLPTGFTGTNYCADVHAHPNGKFVFGSNRGHDSIVVFAFDEKAGRLSFIETVSTQGQFPRNFAIDPTGAFLLAANQRTDNVVTYRIDQRTGRLTPTGQITRIPAPVCLKLIPMFSQKS